MVSDVLLKKINCSCLYLAINADEIVFNFLDFHRDHILTKQIKSFPSYLSIKKRILYCQVLFILFCIHIWSEIRSKLDL